MPGKYCFFYNEKGDYTAPGVYEALEEALMAIELVTESGCGNTLGQCSRKHPDAEFDMFESCDPHFTRDNLPLDYFD